MVVAPFLDKTPQRNARIRPCPELARPQEVLRRLRASLKPSVKEARMDLEAGGYRFDRAPHDVAGQRQSFFGEQRLFALAAARPQSRQMNFAFLTSALSCFRSTLPGQQVIAHNLLS